MSEVVGKHGKITHVTALPAGWRAVIHVAGLENHGKPAQTWSLTAMVTYEDRTHDYVCAVGTKLWQLQDAEENLPQVTVVQVISPADETPMHEDVVTALEVMRRMGTK